MKSFFALLLLAAGASASLNCTVINAPLEEKSCAYPACPAAKKYAVGDMIMAACRSDCSTDTDIWFQLYDGNYVPAVNITGCNYHGRVYQPIILPHCYEEKNLPKPTTCATASYVPPKTRMA